MTDFFQYRRVARLHIGFYAERVHERNERQAVVCCKISKFFKFGNVSEIEFHAVVAAVENDGRRAYAADSSDARLTSGWKAAFISTNFPSSKTDFTIHLPQNFSLRPSVALLRSSSVSATIPNRREESKECPQFSL